MNKSNKQNKKALTLSSKEILKIFRERCDRADLVWRRAFRKVLDTIQELCSKCTTNEQFDHYINELVLYSAFMHFETETLLYGLLKMSELEHRDANMVLDGKLGSFTSTPPQLEDIKRKLTLCSVAGLSHLVKIGEVIYFLTFYYQKKSCVVMFCRWQSLTSFNQPLTPKLFLT